MKPPYQDNIFKKQKNKTGRRFIVICFLGVAIFFMNNSSKKEGELIFENHKLAISNSKNILGAIEKWKKNDYDANGKKDYPLGSLGLLAEIEFINGSRLSLISKRLAKADLRNKEPKACDGYYYTLSTQLNKWPQDEGVSDSVYVVATPEKQGRTGSCIFLINTEGEAYFSNTEFSNKVPSWPTVKEKKFEIWKKLSL